MAGNRRDDERQKLVSQIQEWNANRLDLFEITLPNGEEMEFFGVMRFFYQDSVAKVITKCVRVSSTANTQDVLDTLIEKFRPDMRMLTLPDYALYEVHVNGEERRLQEGEYPLLVQLNWGKDDREGRFLLKRVDDPKIKHSDLYENQEDMNKFKRKTSKRDKKEKKKKDKHDKAKGKENIDSPAKHSMAEEIYNDLPETSFTRTISNPEIVMKRRRQQKLEKKLEQIRTQGGGPDSGGTLKIYGESLSPDVPYKTLLLSTNDTASFIVKETLDKYGLEKEEPKEYCLIQVQSSDKYGGQGKEEILNDIECPLAILQTPFKGSVTFHIRKRSDARKKRRPKSGLHDESGFHHDNQPADDTLPFLLELNPDGTELKQGKRHFLSLNVTEIGSISTSGQHLQLFGPTIQPRHCVIAHTEGIVTVTPTSKDSETYVDGQRIFETTILQHGKIVRFGRHHAFRFCDPSVEQKQQRSPRDGQIPHRAGPYGDHPGEFGYEQGPPGGPRQPEPMVPGGQGPRREELQKRPAEFPQRGFEELLPASLEFRDEGEDAFLATLITEVNGAAVHFKLSPTYILYMAVRCRVTRNMRPEVGMSERVHRLTSLVNKIAGMVQQAIHENRDNAGALAFWMANASELLHFFKQDRDISPYSIDSQDILAEAIQMAFRDLVQCMQGDLYRAMPAFFNDRDDDEDGDDSSVDSRGQPRGPVLGDVIHTLSSAMSLLRRCRVNAALTIQLFSQLFHFINMWLFNQLVLEPSSQLCTRAWGSRLKRHLGRIEAWAEKQGLELAADCHLCRIIQAAHLLQAPKSSPDDIASISSTCFKLNSLQLRALLENYIPAPDEQRIPQDLIESVVSVAANTADELTRSEGRDVRLEEEPDLQLPFLLPEDGYSCDIVKGVPNGLPEFLEPLSQTGICRLTLHPNASGLWTVYMPGNEDTMSPEGGYSNVPPEHSPGQTGDGIPPGLPREPEVMTVSFSKVHGSMGLSIVAAKGEHQKDRGIYVKSVVTGGAAALDGRLQAGDQLLEVDGKNLVGLTQEKAAELMTRTGHTVTLKVAKQGAIYHGLATLLSQPSPETQRAESRRSQGPGSASKMRPKSEDVSRFNGPKDGNSPMRDYPPGGYPRGPGPMDKSRPLNQGPDSQSTPALHTLRVIKARQADRKRNYERRRSMREPGESSRVNGLDLQSSTSSLDNLPLRHRSHSLKDMKDLIHEAEVRDCLAHFDDEVVQGFLKSPRPNSSPRPGPSLRGLERKKSLKDIVLEAEDRDTVARIDNDIVSGKLKCPTPLERTPSAPKDLPKPHLRKASIKDIIVDAEERDYKAEQEVIRRYLKSNEKADELPVFIEKNVDQGQNYTNSFVDENDYQVNGRLPKLSRSKSFKEMVFEAEDRDSKAANLVQDKSMSVPKDISRVYERKCSVKDLVIDGEQRDLTAEQEQEVIRSRRRSVDSEFSCSSSCFSYVYAKPYNVETNVYQAETSSVEVFNGGNGYVFVDDLSPTVERRRSLKELVSGADGRDFTSRMDNDLVNREFQSLSTFDTDLPNVPKKRSSLKDLLHEVEQEEASSKKEDFFGDIQTCQIAFARTFEQDRPVTLSSSEDVNNNEKRSTDEKSSRERRKSLKEIVFEAEDRDFKARINNDIANGKLKCSSTFAQSQSYPCDFPEIDERMSSLKDILVIAEQRDNLAEKPVNDVDGQSKMYESSDKSPCLIAFAQPFEQESNVHKIVANTGDHGSNYNEVFVQVSDVPKHTRRKSIKDLVAEAEDRDFMVRNDNDIVQGSLKGSSVFEKPQVLSSAVDDSVDGEKPLKNHTWTEEVVDGEDGENFERHPKFYVGQDEPTKPAVGGSHLAIFQNLYTSPNTADDNAELTPPGTQKQADGLNHTESLFVSLADFSKPCEHELIVDFIASGTQEGATRNDRDSNVVDCVSCGQKEVLIKYGDDSFAPDADRNVFTRDTDERQDTVGTYRSSMRTDYDDEDSVFDTTSEAELLQYQKYLERDDDDSEWDLQSGQHSLKHADSSPQFWVSDEMREVQKILKRKTSVGDLITDTELRPFSTVSSLGNSSEIPKSDMKRLSQRKSSVRDLVSETEQLRSRPSSSLSRLSDASTTSLAPRDLRSLLDRRSSVRDLTVDIEAGKLVKTEVKKGVKNDELNHSLARKYSVPDYVNPKDSLRDLVYYEDCHNYFDDEKSKTLPASTSPHRREIARLRNKSVTAMIGNEESSLRDLVYEIDKYGKPKKKERKLSLTNVSPERRELHRLRSLSSIPCANELGDLRELVNEIDQNPRLDREVSLSQTTPERREIEQLRSLSSIPCKNELGNLRELVCDLDVSGDKPKPERKVSLSQMSTERREIERLRRLSSVTCQNDLVNLRDLVYEIDDSGGEKNAPAKPRQVSPERRELHRLQSKTVTTLINQQERPEDREGGFPPYGRPSHRGQEPANDPSRSKSTSNLKAETMDRNIPQQPRPAMSASTLPRNYQQRQPQPEYINRPGPQDPRDPYANRPVPADQRDYVNRPGPQDVRDPRDPRNQPTYQNYPPPNNRYGPPAHVRQPDHGRASPYQQTQTIQDTMPIRQQEPQFQGRPQEPQRQEPSRQEPQRQDPSRQEAPRQEHQQMRHPSSSSMKDRPKSTHEMAPHRNDLDRQSRPKSEYYDRNGRQPDRYDQRPPQSPYGREDIPRSEANNQQYQQNFYQNAPMRSREATPPFEQMRRPSDDRPKAPTVAPKPSVMPKPDKNRVPPQEIPREDIDNRRTQPNFFDPAGRQEAPRSPYQPPGTHPGSKSYPDDRYHQDRPTPPRQEHLYDNTPRTNGSPELPPPPPELMPAPQPEEPPAEELPPPPPPPVHDYVNYDPQGRIIPPSSEAPRQEQWRAGGPPSQQQPQQYSQYGGPQSREGDPRTVYSFQQQYREQPGPQPQEPYRPQNRLESQRSPQGPPWQNQRQYPGQAPPPQQLTVNTSFPEQPLSDEKQLSPSPWEKEEKDRQRRALESQDIMQRNQVVDDLQSKPFLSPDDQERLRRLRLEQEFQRRVEEAKARGSDDDRDDSDEELTDRAKAIFNQGRSALLHMINEDLEKSKQRLAEKDVQRKREEEQGERERNEKQERILQQLEQQRNEERMRNQMRQEKKQREHEEWLRKQRATGAHPEQRSRLPSSEKERLRQRLEEQMNSPKRVESPPPDRQHQVQELREKQRREQEEHKRMQMMEEEKLRTRREEEVRQKREQERQQMREMEAARDAEERAIREEIRRKEEQSRQMYQYHTYQNIDNKGGIAPPPPERKSSYDLLNQHGYRSNSSSTLPRNDPQNSKKSVSFNNTLDNDSSTYNNVPPVTQQPNQPAPFSYMSSNNNNPDPRYQYKPPASPSTQPAPAPQERFDSPSTQQSSVQYTTTSTPGVIGAQEIYRDPRARIEARRNSERLKGDTGEKLSFKDKMKLFAAEAGENTPKERPKSSSLQRAIEYSLNGQ